MKGLMCSSLPGRDEVPASRIDPGRIDAIAMLMLVNFIRITHEPTFPPVEPTTDPMPQEVLEARM